MKSILKRKKLSILKQAIKKNRKVTKKRMFMFEGKKRKITSSGGYGHLTVTENDGTEVEYEVVLNDVLKPADF